VHKPFAPIAGNQSLGQIVVGAPVSRAIGVGQSAMGNGRMKIQPVILVLPRASAYFYVSQAIPVSDLSERHGKELVPIIKVRNPVVALVAVGAAAKCFAINPVRNLTEKWLLGAHSISVALTVPQNDAKRNQNRQHRGCCASCSHSNVFVAWRLSKADVTKIQQVI
jgi:hypothetical protein